METFDNDPQKDETKDGSIQMIRFEVSIFVKASRLLEPRKVADIIQTVTTPIKFQMALN